ncbi:MAG: transposase [Bacterioplanes sp.]|nr:transposase [Bacterioplanes sp.]
MLSDSAGHRRLRVGRFSQPNGIYLITAVTVNRAPLFADWSVGCAAVRAFSDATLLKNSQLLCWVLMPDHVHWMVQLGPEADLSTLVGAMKSSSARSVRRLGVDQAVWAAGFHDRAIRRDEDIVAAARYVVANPLRAGLVRRFGGYPFWDSVWV